MTKVIGIDLGTTNSVISVMQGKEPVIIPNSDGQRTTPSVVAYTKRGDLLVGQSAKRQAALNPANTFYSIKRFIGRKTSEVTEELKVVPYKVIQKDDTIKLYCPVLRKEFTAEELSALILRKLSDDASEYLKEKVDQAVITVPAYFNDSQRQATKDAGKIAGLDVLRIINEPTAASLSYGFNKQNNETETILVFDLGGGTLDVSILEVGEGVFEVLATAGDTQLGGDDFDEKIVKWLLQEFEDQEKVSLLDNPNALQRFAEAAEKAKIELSLIEETEINLPFLTLGNEKSNDKIPRHLNRSLTRDRFEELCADLVQRCEVPIVSVLKDAAKKRYEGVDQVVLVGGSTRIPTIKKIVEKVLGKVPNQSVNPDEVVSLGAAIQAGVLGGQVNDVVLLDVTPLSLGLETYGGITTTITPRNTIVPNKKVQTFSTAADSQSSVDIHVLQGERKFARDNKSLGRFNFGGIAPAPAGVPKIVVTFDIDVNGILSVKAQDQDTLKEQSLTITGSSTLPKEEIERLVQEAERQSSADAEKLKQVMLKNKAQKACLEAKKELSERKDQIKSEEKEKIENLISAIEELNNKDEYPNKESELEDLLEKLSVACKMTT